MSAYRSQSFRIIGIAPLLMHNGQLSDPLNPHSQAIASIAKRRQKTLVDHEELILREFMGSLYLQEGEPCIPAEMFEAALVKGAAKERRAADAKAGLMVESNAKLEYDGPRDPVQLAADPRFRLRVPVKVRQDKVMRTRPRFDGWSAELKVKFQPSLLDADQVRRFLITAGEQIGIGDWRPRFGRFLVA
jgi:hypothetical protein